MGMIDKKLKEGAADKGFSLDDWEPVDFLLWRIKEAYITGLLEGTLFSFRAAEMGISKLFAVCRFSFARVLSHGDVLYCLRERGEFGCIGIRSYGITMGWQEAI